MKDGFMLAGLVLFVWLAAYGAASILITIVDWPTCG